MVLVSRFNDDCAKQSRLFLEAGMAVIQGGAALDYRYAVVNVLFCSIPGKLKSGTPSMLAGKQNRVPMDGLHRLQTVRDRQRNGVASPIAALVRARSRSSQL